MLLLFVDTSDVEHTSLQLSLESMHIVYRNSECHTSATTLLTENKANKKSTGADAI